LDAQAPRDQYMHTLAALFGGAVGKDTMSRVNRTCRFPASVWRKGESCYRLYEVATVGAKYKKKSYEGRSIIGLLFAATRDSTDFTAGNITRSCSSHRLLPTDTRGM
jgi:hypothetical protein